VIRLPLRTIGKQYPLDTLVQCVVLHLPEVLSGQLGSDALNLGERDELLVDPDAVVGELTFDLVLSGEVEYLSKPSPSQRKSVTSRRVSPSLASRSAISERGLLKRLIAVFSRSRVPDSHLGTLLLGDSSAVLDRVGDSSRDYGRRLRPAGFGHDWFLSEFP